ncbi:MAG: ABC transporter ATP-binding protein [Oscillospiraceae bacterium]|jgi:sn-glycerol 3-phosphate transport system ATP-binding protein|nr:ABC transporter ATP-binding protein [Oscillospiraceae bacterium]
MSGNIGVHNVVKDFGAAKVLKDISLDIEEGSFTILLGPSGCGKSTLLRIIAGLETPDAGFVTVDGEDITDYEPKDRHIAMVFQNYALYPHMTAFRNVEYGLKIRKIEKSERRRMVNEVLEQVELADQAHKLPAQMSGGQRQRVALARAIVKRPKAFLMDEPLSNLDAKLRTQMRFELIDMYKKLNTTFLYVTHDQVEAMSMGTYIVIMNQGVIMQQGTPREIYEDPRNLFVAQFIGSPPANIIEHENGYIGIRPENITLSDTPDGEFCLPARVHSAEQLGGETIYHLNTSAGKINVKISGCWEQENSEPYAVFNLDKTFLFDSKGNRIPDNDRVLRAVLRGLDGGERLAAFSFQSAG